MKRERVVGDEVREGLFFFFSSRSDVVLVITVTTGLSTVQGEGAWCGFWSRGPFKGAPGAEGAAAPGPAARWRQAAQASSGCGGWGWELAVRQ